MPVAAMESQVGTRTDSSEVSADVLTSSSTTMAPETGGFFAGVGHFPPPRPATQAKTGATQPLMSMTTDEQTCLRCVQVQL